MPPIRLAAVRDRVGHFVNRAATELIADRQPSEPGLGLRRILEEQAVALGDAPFASLPDGSLSFRGVNLLANRAANVLSSRGVRPGDVVPVLSGNRLAVLAVWFGCAKLGAVFCPINALLTGDQLLRVLDQAGGRVIVCEASRQDEIATQAASLPRMDSLLVTGTNGPESFDSLLEAASELTPLPLDSDPGAPCKLMFTSGTTGWPKGVIWSRTCETTWARAYGDELIPIDRGESIYTALPLFHVTAQGTVQAALWRGGQVTVDSGFDPFMFWDRVRAANAVAFTYVGTILSTLVRRPPRPDDGDNPVRLIVGAAAPKDRWAEIESRFGARIVETWGQTETASCWMRPERLPQRPGSVGVPSPNMEVRLVRPSGSEAGPGRVGELWIRPRAPHIIFEGYFREGPLQLEDGWYPTGDLLREGAGGEFEFVGRLREAIRRRGEMIPAGVVEEAALAHPDVLEAAAVAVPDEVAVEEEIKLCIVTREGAPIDPAQLLSFLRVRLPRFMVPRYIEIRSQLPKTPSTRIRRLELSLQGTDAAWDAKGRRPASNSRP